ncbi:hypothetical protein [Halobacteriovorax sp. JY17]|uniref:hypothetical protein n=1 Tax=Halobacteriovorax sp. JY17 TaxID=2014617 RepID=UPI0025C1DE9A|nr:hypothetical protein [Halobacteriovorax sp. JY17]
MMKNILLIIFLMQPLLVLGDTEVDPFVETLEKFEKYCIDQNDELREDVYISDEFFSCRDSLDYLKVEFENREELMSSNPDVYKQFQDCVEQRDNPRVIPFVEEVQEVTNELACNESEKKEFEKDCGKAWECNKLRAIKDGASLLPKVVRNPIQKYVRNTVKEKNYDSECIADGKSNCVKDFVYAFAANLWSSASSVWNLVSKGTKSLFNIGGWFDDEADKLHAKAVQSKKDVEDFWDDPGKWFSNLIDNIKKGVDDWVRSSVFCGKWEGKPQFSKCLQPLENYECIDCDDKINATCVAIGAISSEVGVAFLTAGVGTAASLSARAGAKTLATIAGKVSTKVKTIAPSFSKTSKVSKSSMIGKTSAALGAGISKSTSVAIKIYSVTSEKALRLKGKIEKISKSVSESKVVMITKAVVEKGNIPGRISEKIAEKGVLAGAKVVSKVGRGAVKADAEKIVKIAQRAKTSDRAQRILSERTHEKSRLSGHNAKATTLVKRGERVPDSSGMIGGNGHSSSHGESGGNSSNRGNYEQRDRSVTANDRAHHQDRSKTEGRNSRNTEGQQANNKNGENSQHRSDQRKREEQKRIAEQRKKEEVKKAHEEREHHEEKPKNDLQITKTAVAASLGTHLAAKGIIISNEQAEKEIEKIHSISNGKNEEFNDSLVSAKKVLGVENMNSLSKEGLEQAKAVKDIYSEANKDRIVSEIQNSNSKLSKSEAERVFDQRKEQVNGAYDYMERLQARNSIPDRDSRNSITSAKDELKNIGRKNELSELGSELSKLAKQREAIEEGIETQEPSKSDIIAADPREMVAASPRENSDREIEGVVDASSSASGLAGNSSSSSSSSGPSMSDYSEGTMSAETDSEKSSSSAPEDGVPDIVDNELIEEAISKTKDSLESDDEKKNKKSSRDLKNLLSKIGDKPSKIESNIFFTRNLNSIKAFTEKSKKRLASLIERVKNSEKIEKKFTYNLGTEKLELYQFKGESFHLKIGKTGTVEIIDGESGSMFLNRAALNLE